MKLIVELNSFKQILEIVCRAIDSNPTLPILSNILLKTEGKRLFLSGTNLESAIRGSLEVDVKNEGSVAIPAKILLNYINYLKTPKIEFQSNGDDLNIKAGKSQTKIKGLPVGDFPILPEIATENTFSLESKKLEQALKQTTFTCATNSTRPILTGVCFIGEKNKLNLISTDGYRLSESSLDLSEKLQDRIKIIISARVLNELQKILQLTDKVILIINENQVVFKIAEVEIFTRLIEGTFPDYKMIIPKEFKTETKVSVDGLSLIIRQVSALVEDTNRSILLEIEKDQLKVATKTTQLGEGSAELEIETQGEPQKINLNADYLLAALGSFGGGKITLKIKDSSSAIVMVGEKEGEYLHLIMPLKS